MATTNTNMLLLLLFIFAYKYEGVRVGGESKIVDIYIMQQKECDFEKTQTVNHNIVSCRTKTKKKKQILILNNQTAGI